VCNLLRQPISFFARLGSTAAHSPRLRGADVSRYGEASSDDSRLYPELLVRDALAKFPRFIRINSLVNSKPPEA
jgi:hypothetical protein